MKNFSFNEITYHRNSFKRQHINPVNIGFKPVVIFGFFLFLSCLLQDVQAQVIKGKVLEELKLEPIPEATVILLNPDSSIATYTSANKEGFFFMKVPKPGQYHLKVRRIGYSENGLGPFQIEIEDTASIELRMLPEAVIMDELVIEGESFSVNLYQNDFYKRRKSRPGQFFTRKDIEKYSATYPSHVFFWIPQVTVKQSNLSSGYLLYNRRYGQECLMTVVVDGMVVIDNRSVASIDDYIPSVDQIEGVEVYSGQVGVPAQYKGSGTHCGTVVIWTRL